MSFNKTYSNISGTTSKTFQIGKNRLIVNNEDKGILIFEMIDSGGTSTQWKINSNENLIEFPTGEKFIINSENKEVLFSLGQDNEITLGLTPEDESDPGALKIKTSRKVDEVEIEEIIKIGVDNIDEEESPEFEVNKKNIPNIQAVWDAIKKIRDDLKEDINTLKSRADALELLTDIITESMAVQDPGSWDE